MLPRPWIVASLVAGGEYLDPQLLPESGLIPSTTGEEFNRQVDVARRALQCPALQRLRRDVTEPLTVRRFLGNIRDSFANTFLRVPPDPDEAVRQLCPAENTRVAPARAWLAPPTREPIDPISVGDPRSRIGSPQLAQRDYAVETRAAVRAGARGPPEPAGRRFPCG